MVKNIHRNNNLRNARRNKNDEFYTRLTDIENELKHYEQHFKDKVVYCNSDDPLVSNFFKYFAMNFKRLGIKKLITACYRNTDPDMNVKGVTDKAVWSEYKGGDYDTIEEIRENISTYEFNGDGDFRSDESIALLEESDIVVTNPPFSLFREYVIQLTEYGKQFLILGNNNAITYKELFPLIKENKVWLGNNSNKTMEFELSPTCTKWYRIDENGNKIGKVPAISWFTNMDIDKHHENLILNKYYKPEDYPVYDNFNAINVDRVKDIPIDYDGVMGVPITYLCKHNPDQFNIVDGLSRYTLMDSQGTNEIVRANKSHTCNINGETKYFRVAIKHKHP